MIIFDEAHFLKNSDAQRSKAAKLIVKATDAIIQMLSGTITMSRPSELWNILVLTGYDKAISKSWKHFIERYCNGYKGSYGWVSNGATNTLELNQKLRNLCYLRREKRDVLDELPDVIKTVLGVPITNKREIKRATDDFIGYIMETQGEEAADRAMGAEHLVALTTFRKLAIAGKTKAIRGYIKEWQEGDKKLIIFGVHKEFLQPLAEEFDCPLIAGGVSSKKKQQIVNEWKTSDKQFLFANIQSGGTGIDGLQEVCSNLIIAELPWRPSDLIQAIGRIDRSGQTIISNAIFMLSDDTIDKQMWEMLLEKEIITEAVNKGIDIEEEESGMRVVINKLLELGKKGK